MLFSSPLPQVTDKHCMNKENGDWWLKHLMLQAWECVWHANVSWNDAGYTSKFGGSLSLTRAVTVFPRVPLSLTNSFFTTWHILFYHINPKRVTKLNHLCMIAEYCVGRRSALRAVPLDNTALVLSAKGNSWFRVTSSVIVANVSIHLQHVSCYLHVFSEVGAHLPTVWAVASLYLQPRQGNCSDGFGDSHALACTLCRSAFVNERIQRAVQCDSVPAYQFCTTLYFIMIKKKMCFASCKHAYYTEEELCEETIWSE